MGLLLSKGILRNPLPGGWGHSKPSDAVGQHSPSEPRTERSGVSGRPLTPLRSVRGSEIPSDAFARGAMLTYASRKRFRRRPELRFRAIGTAQSRKPGSRLAASGSERAP